MSDEGSEMDELGEEKRIRTKLPTKDDNDGLDGSGYYRNVSCGHCDADLGSIEDDSRIQYVEYRFACENCGEPTVIEAAPPSDQSEE